MKKYYLSILLIMIGVFSYGHLQAQRRGQVNRNIVKINPLSLATLTFNTSYERMISHSSALQLGAFYTGVSYGGMAYSGFGITPEVRLYFFGSRNVPEGLHLSPFARFQHFDLELQGFSEEGDKIDAHSLGVGVLLGYQWLLGRNDNISLDLFAGPMLVNAKINFNGFFDDHHELRGIPSGLALRSGLTLGFAF